MLWPSTPAPPRLPLTSCQPFSSVYRRHTLSIKLYHFAPLTPLSSAANRRSFQTERSIHVASDTFDEPCLAGLADTDGSLRFLLLSLISGSFASLFLPPFPHRGFCSPRLSLPCDNFSTMKALTPACRHLGGQASSLISQTLPHVPPSTTETARMSLSQPACSAFGEFQASPSPRELAAVYRRIKFVSCGPRVRRRLLPTPPHGDAVSFGYRVVAFPDTDFHRAVSAPSRAH